MNKIMIAVLLTIMIVLTACGPAEQPQAQQPPQEQPQQTQPETTEPIVQPQEQQPQEEQKQPETTETKPSNFVTEDNQAANVVYDDVGMITDVSCDFDKGTVSFHFKNVADYTLNMYKGEVPTPPSALKFSLNGRQFNSAKTDLRLNCGKDEFTPGEEADCFGENVVYRIDAAFNQRQQNRLLGQIVGLSDETIFECGKAA